MQLNLTGKVAIVTGGSLGIGKSISLRLAIEGCKVVVAARRQEPIDQLVAEIRAEGGDALGVIADLSSSESIVAMIDKTAAHYGAVHILVNNAGGGAHPYKFDDITDGDWEVALALNLMGPVRAARAAAPYMREQKWGRIINISSAAGVQPEAIYAHYSAAKAALNNFTKTLSRALGRDGITVNTVSPGLVRSAAFADIVLKAGAEKGLDAIEAERQFVTKLRPGNVRGRAGDPEEVADLVAFLASERSAYITGTNMRIDGGATLAV
jgi:3-oxoacyl-[acyl-carrier protein] reductase